MKALNRLLNWLSPPPCLHQWEHVGCYRLDVLDLSGQPVWVFLDRCRLCKTPRTMET